MTHNTEMKQREGALAQSELSYRTIFDSASDAIFLHDAETGRILDANKTACRIWGYSLEELKTRDLRAIGFGIPPYTHKEAMEWVRKAVKDGPQFFDWIARRREGTPIWFENSLQRVTIDGKDRVLVVARDITDRKRAEDALRESEERYRQSSQLLASILEHTYIMAVYLDTKFNFIWVNRAYAETCRQDPSFFPGKNHFDLYPNEENQAIFQRVMDTGEHFFVNAKPFLFPDQPERGITYWDWSLYPVRDSGGNIVGLVFTLNEVTERIRMEEKVREGVLQLQEAVRAGKVGLWDWNVHSNKVFYSPEWKRQIGYEDHEIINDLMEWQSRVHPEDLDRCLQAVRAFSKRQKSDYQIEFRFRHKDGSYRWILSQGAILTDKQGKPVRMLGSHVDITERKLMQEEKEKLILELKDALGKVKVLSGLLPICASCKKIRNDKGHWEQMEQYISDRSEADFTHSLCPECGKKLYPEWYEKK